MPSIRFLALRRIVVFLLQPATAQAMWYTWPISHTNTARWTVWSAFQNSARRFRDGGLPVFALHTFFTYPRYDDIREEGIAARLNCSHNKLRVTVAGRSREHTSAVRALPL